MEIFNTESVTIKHPETATKFSRSIMKLKVITQQ